MFPVTYTMSSAAMLATAVKRQLASSTPLSFLVDVAQGRRALIVLAGSGDQ